MRNCEPSHAAAVSFDVIRGKLRDLPHSRLVRAQYIWGVAAYLQKSSL